jgi:hypothetical protein
MDTQSVRNTAEGIRMKKKFVCAMIIFWLCIAETVWSATDVNAVPKKDWLTSFKNPTDWLELEADLRLRAEYYNNKKLDSHAAGHEQLVFPRYRIRAGAKIKITDDVDFNFRFVTEPRYYILPKTQDPPFVKNEVLFDKFNLVVRNAFNLPLTITAGRQDILLGSGWLICDGTPLDGGRTQFFDALRFQYDIPEHDSTLDVVLIDDHADSAKWFKPFNDQDEDLSEQDEQGAIVYLSKKTGERSGIDGYMIYKHYTERAIASGYEGEVYTLGLRKYGVLSDHWDYSMEFAPQFGHINGKNLQAFGTNNQLIYNFNDEKKNKIVLGYEYLSGNDDKQKNFDKCFGRVDTWSVLYQGNIDSIDGRIYDSSNLHRLYAEWRTNLSKKTELLTGYNLLFADDNPSTAGTGGLSKNGKFRGQLLRAVLRYKVSKNIEHRFEGELFLPGDFYNDDKNDPAVFVRYGLYLTL